MQANGNARGPGTPSLPQGANSSTAQPRQAVPQTQGLASARPGHPVNAQPPANYAAASNQAGAGRYAAIDNQAWTLECYCHEILAIRGPVSYMEPDSTCAHQCDESRTALRSSCNRCTCTPLSWQKMHSTVFVTCSMACC